MQTKKTRVRMVAVIAALLLASPLVLAQGMRGDSGDRPDCGMREGMGMGMGMGMEMHGMLSRLDLDDSQRDAIHAVFEEFQPRLEAVRGTVADLSAELHEAVEASGYDEAVLRPTAEAKGDALAELTLLQIQMHWRIRELLTPEQIAKLKAMHDSGDCGGNCGGDCDSGCGGHGPGHGPGHHHGRGTGDGS